MIGTIGRETAIRAAAAVVVVTLVALALGSVGAAGWQHGTDVTDELGSEPEGTADPGDDSRAETGAAIGSAKRDGDANGTDRPTGTDESNGSDDPSAPECDASGTATENEPRTGPRPTADDPDGGENEASKDFDRACGFSAPSAG